LDVAAAEAFAGFYPTGTSLDPATVIYDGPGGKPVPAVESWDAPGSLTHERVLVNKDIKPTTILPDLAHGVIHVVESDGTIRALDPETLQPVGTPAPVTKVEVIINAAATLDPVNGSVFIQDDTRFKELRWNTQTKSYSVTELPGPEIGDGQGTLAYN